MKQYKIVKGYYWELDVEVSAKIKEGWEPLGGVTVDDNNYLFQAMVKEERDAEDDE